MCHICDKVFTQVSNKRTHERNIHGVHLPSRPIQYKDDGRSTLVKCKECNEAYPTLNNYRHHLLVKHDIETHKTYHEFTSEKEFLAWKGSVEMDVGINYTTHAGSWKSSEGKKQIFYCRRSGEKSSTKTQDTSEKKCTDKSQGTCKLGLYCTSSMEVVKADGWIRVTFYTDHHDHELGFPNLVHMVLPKSEKDRIAGMIMQGIEHHKILERVWETSGRNRTSILEKDIENIIAAYGLSVNQSRHSDDSTSVRLIAQDMKDAGELLYFKDQGQLDPQNTEIPSEEFVLAFMKEEQQLMFSEQLKNTDKLQVCMDSTHCISQYTGFQLTTLMTITDLHQGFPVAFLISSTVNTEIVKVFLDKIKDRMGVVQAQVFMSDDDPLFRNAWYATMGRKNICKHIHAVGNFLKNKSHPSKPKSPTEEIEMKQDIVCKEDSTRSQVEEQITEVKMKLPSLLSECDEMKDLDSVKALNNHLSKAYCIVHAGRTYPVQSNNLPVDTSTVLNPSNKNVVKQDRLHSTKKRKQKDEARSLKKPNVRARQEIVESLAKSQSDISFPILSTGAICDEHNYC
ncbi:hypothetical protein Pmani_037227 [Petrolisthes manimaculis]|uniref:C2H2-type domain-containing protein n=1 Tax=Petrolisthes manimaculis TaxID=1843537 RepID=A0AAE1NJK6_9EUCA|nr:hypothetical protein Pmani_037227 [Petrolisthes manimaculis]